MIEAIIILIVLCVVFYILYINGYMVVNAKTALTYVGSDGGWSARFSSCSGSIRRRIRIKESRAYHFEFFPELIQGEMTIELLDAKKQNILSLDREHNCESIDLSKNSRYCLIYRFKSATGSFVLKHD